MDLHITSSFIQELSENVQGSSQSRPIDLEIEAQRLFESFVKSALVDMADFSANNLLHTSNKVFKKILTDMMVDFK